MKTLIATHFLASNLFYEGGPLFMSLILMSLIAAVICLILGFVNLKKDTAKVDKMLKMASDASLLGLVLGFLGSVIGLISAFDSIEAMGSPTPEIFAAGLKVSLITAAFGLFQFVLSRIGILLLRGMQK